MPSWPPTLPEAPITEGYWEELPHPVIEPPVDGGAARLKYTAAAKAYGEPFMMTTTQWETLQAFYIDDLKYGSIPFDWRERGDLSKPLAQFRIVGKPRADFRVGVEWLVWIPLVKLP